MHDSLKIKHDATFGLGLLAAREIKQGADLIILPDHLALRLPATGGEEEHDTVLLDLFRRVPGTLIALSSISVLFEAVLSKFSIITF